MAVKVITDSTADLPEEVIKDLDIGIVPLTVLFGDEAYKDGVEITREEFFDRLARGPVHPRTSQPPIGDFVDVYKSLAEQGHDIVSVHISEKLSGSLNSARLAAAELPDANITIVDSQLAALALGLVVKTTAEAARDGKSPEAVAAVARDAASKTNCYVILDTLEYLQKGGRIGKAQALLGSLISIKPILTVRDGEVHPYEKIRTHARAVARLREIASQKAPYAELALIQEGHPETLKGLLDHLSALSNRPAIVGKLGVVVGVYAGPGVVGIALRQA